MMNRRVEERRTEDTAIINLIFTLILGMVQWSGVEKQDALAYTLSNDNNNDTDHIWLGNQLAANLVLCSARFAAVGSSLSGNLGVEKDGI